MFVKLYRVFKVRNAEPPIIQSKWFGLQTLEVRAAKPAEYSAERIAEGEAAVVARDCVWAEIDLNSLAPYETPKETRLALNASKLGVDFKAICKANACHVASRFYHIAEAREADESIVVYIVPVNDTLNAFLDDLTRRDEPLQATI